MRRCSGLRREGWDRLREDCTAAAGRSAAAAIFAQRPNAEDQGAEMTLSQ